MGHGSGGVKVARRRPPPGAASFPNKIAAVAPGTSLAVDRGVHKRPPMLPLVAGGWLLGLLLASLIAPVESLLARTALACATLALTTVLAAWGFTRIANEPTTGAVRIATWLAAGAALAAGLAAGTTPAPPPALPPAGMARLQAHVEQVRASADGSSRARIRIERGHRLEDGAFIAPGTRLWTSPQPLPAGARVELLAKVTPRLPFRNPSPHPRLPDAHPTAGRAFIPGPDAVRILAQPGASASLEHARDHVRAALARTLAPAHAGIARALVLGEGSAVTAAERDRVRDAGLAHVLAVSGLHVAILAGFAVLLLRELLVRTPLSRRFEVARIAAALGIPLALAYACFAGGASSAWRAAITACIAWGLLACGRRAAGIEVAASAVLLLSVATPARALSPGFLLSVVATAAVLSAQRSDEGGLSGWLRAAFSVSARTTLATAPIVLWCFGSVPVAGVIANVVLVPLASLLLVPLAATHAVIAAVTPQALAPLAGPTAWAFALVCDAFVGAAGVFASVGAGLEWPPPSVAQGVTLAIATGLLLIKDDLRARVVITLVCALLIGGLEWNLRRTERPTGVVRATFLDVGQGDAALVDLPDGRLMLIDAGGNPGGGPDPGRAALLPLLRARRRDRIDIAVLTHPHPDHHGGLRALLDSVPITELWDSGQAQQEADLSPTSAEASGIIEALRARGTVIQGPPDLCGRVRHAGDAAIRVLSPCPGYDSGHDENDNSLVLRIDHHKRSFLFTGDAEAHAEGVMLQDDEPLRADVLKVGHHGSRTSTTAPFLAAVSPEIAIISAGAGNRFGHPHAEVDERLRARVPLVHNLAQTGGLIIVSDGHTLRH